LTLDTRLAYACLLVIRRLLPSVDLAIAQLHSDGLSWRRCVLQPSQNLGPSTLSRTIGGRPVQIGMQHQTHCVPVPLQHRLMRRPDHVLHENSMVLVYGLGWQFGHQ
jgi:hypothetical protein